ncbi:DUF5133 domain-containing protein [Streptomyces sp. NPDC005492]|uniref:DUF5133 domain-containing protein n=1 Tax=Streptomyces sp. NPDC005492 TaxID=3156883 RepID=UPI0033A9F958
MVTPPPRILRVLLARYAEACVRMLEHDTAARRNTLKDIANTLCAVTGTGEIREALTTADRLLAEEQADAAARRHGAGPTRNDRTLTA